MKPSPDASTVMEGVYSLTFSSYTNSQQINFGKPGSMTLVSTSPTAVRATINLTGLGYLSQNMSESTWTLTNQKKDTIDYSASGGFYGQYRSGLINMSGLADGTIFLRFKKQ